MIRQNSAVPSTARRARHLLHVLLVMMLMLSARPLRANEPLCTTPASCSAPADFIWVVTALNATVTPDAGGLLVDNDGLFSLTFPPHAVAEPLLVSVTSTLTTSRPVEDSMRGLGYFNLTAIDTGGTPHAGAQAPWMLTFTYADCDGNTDCLLAQVDEASLRCRLLDADQTSWLPVDSHANVFANRVTCSSRSFGRFALFADLLQTSGERDQSHIYLPLLRQ